MIQCWLTARIVLNITWTDIGPNGTEWAGSRSEWYTEAARTRGHSLQDLRFCSNKKLKTKPAVYFFGTWLGLSLAWKLTVSYKTDLRALDKFEPDKHTDFWIYWAPFGAKNLIKIKFVYKYSPAAGKSDVISTTAIIIDVRGGVTCSVLRVNCSIDSGVLVSLSVAAIIRHQRDFKWR